MRVSIRPVAGCLLSLAVCFLATGCGSKDKDGKVTGKILVNNQPFQGKLTNVRLPPGEDAPAQIIFYPITADNQTVLAGDNEPMPGGVGVTVRADGTFEVIVGKNGIKPGKHRIVIKHIDPNTDADVLKGKFNERNSKINRDLKDGDDIVIDLAKPGG
jgi:hypothetical protein